MKRILLLTLFFALTIFSMSFMVFNKSMEIVVRSDSEVSISGTSNISSFNCCYNINEISEVIPVRFETNDESTIFYSTELELKSSCFDCGHKAINKDFNKLLKSELYPEIKLKLIAIEKSSKRKNTYHANVEISIADVVNSCTIPVTVAQYDDMHINGELHIDLRDYQLEAPKKVMGLVVVNPNVVVNFNLFIKQI